MVTTTSNNVASRFNDRMPVVLSEDEAEACLDDEPAPTARLADLGRGLPADALLAHEHPPTLKIMRSERKHSEPSGSEPKLF